MESRTWRPPFALDIVRVLAPLRRGSGDPSTRFDETGAWWAATTADGPVTLRVERAADSAVHGTAWGPGARAALDTLPELLGADDDASDFIAHHEIVRRGQRAGCGMRLCATGRVWDVLLVAVLEQKVTNREAWRSWRELCRRFGSEAPDGTSGLRVPPDPARLRTIPDWEWHRMGVDGQRRRTLKAIANVAGRLERAVSLGGSAGRDLLCKVPGIGPWTAAEVAQRAWGDSDAISIGDFHLPTVVGNALLGKPVDDEGMLAALAPYNGHRHRAVRYVQAAGARRPRFGPRMPVRNYREI